MSGHSEITPPAVAVGRSPIPCRGTFASERWGSLRTGAARALTSCAIVLIAIGLPGCAALGEVVQYIDPATGEVTETTVGDLAADTVESFAAQLGSVVNGAATAATGNPIVGAGAGAALLTLLGAGASKLRRKS